MRSVVPAGIVALLHHLADDPVHLLVRLEDRVAVLRVALRRVERVLRIDVVPHHVLHPVGELEVVHVDVPVVLEQAGEDLLLLGDREVDVLVEDLVVDRAALDRPGVDHPADRLEEAEARGELAREGARRRDVEDRRQVRGVELDRREIDPHLGLDREHPEAADAGDLDQRS